MSQETPQAYISPFGHAEHENSIINGRYILHEKIGQGGMGVVYRAIDRLTGDIVALKRITKNLGAMFGSSISADTPQKLRHALAQEFQILAGLRHPHIVSVLDYGFGAEQNPFFTMDYLDGAETLLIAGQKRDYAGKIELIEETLQALTYLHRRGVLHKDIKPRNILVSNGRVYLVDFGLSASPSQRSALSGGTLLYMAPEIYEEEQAYSYASDLYSLGVIMYELLAGVHLYSAVTTPDEQGPSDVIYAVSVLGLESGIAEFLQKMLKKQPEERYLNAQEALVALSRAQGDLSPPESSEIRESFLQAATFIGREQEFGQLQTVLEEATPGTPSVWLVGGESGVGKSRLIDEVRTHALVNGWQVLNGQAIAEGGSYFQLWRTIAERLLLSTAITTDEAAILQLIVPRLNEILQQETAAAPPTGQGAQQQISATLLSLLQRQTQPTLLLLEDLHWVRESLLPIQALLSEGDTSAPLVLIGSYRNDETSDLSRQLKGGKGLILGRFTEPEIVALSQAILGEQVDIAPIASLLVQETEGNTFFLVESMRALAQEAGQLQHIGRQSLPTHIFTQGMAQLLQRRIEKLSHSDLALLQTAAIVGRQIDLNLLGKTYPNVDLAGWVQRVSDAAILIVRDNRWLFAHDKLRDTVLAIVATADKRRLHRQAAEAIEATYPEMADHNEALLEHWHQAGDIGQELHYLPQVAERLITLYADIKHAAELIERGLQAVPDTDVRTAVLLNWLAQISMQQSKPQEAKRYAEKAYQLATRNDDLHEIGMSFMHLGGVAWYANEIDQAQRYYEQCLEVFMQLNHQPYIARSYRYLGMMHKLKDEVQTSVFYNEKAVAIVESLNDQASLMAVLLSQADMSFALQEYAQTEQYLERTLALATKLGNKYCQAQALQILGNVRFQHADYEAAKRCYRQTIAISEEFENARMGMFGYFHLGTTLYLQSRSADAAVQLHIGLELAKKAGLPLVVYNATKMLVLVYLDLGKSEAKPYLQQAFSLAEEVITDRPDTGFVLVWMAHLMHHGQPERAAMLWGAIRADVQEIGLKIAEKLTAELEGMLDADIYQNALASDEGGKLLHLVDREFLGLVGALP